MAAKTSAAERAAEALGVAERRVANTSKRLENARAHVEELTAELGAAKTLRDYAAANPALEPTPESDPEPTGGRAEVLAARVEDDPF